MYSISQSVLDTWERLVGKRIGSMKHTICPGTTVDGVDETYNMPRNHSRWSDSTA